MVVKTVRVPREQFLKAAKKATSTGPSLSEIGRRILQEYLESGGEIPKHESESAMLSIYGLDEEFLRQVTQKAIAHGTSIPDVVRAGLERLEG